MRGDYRQNYLWNFIVLFANVVFNVFPVVFNVTSLTCSQLSFIINIIRNTNIRIKVCVTPFSKNHRIMQFKSFHWLSLHSIYEP